MKLDPDRKLAYAGMYVLKKLDLAPNAGGEVIGVLDPKNAAIEEVLDRLTIQGFIAIDRKQQRYVLTAAGIAHLGELIDEAEGYVTELDELEMDALLAELERRNLDPMRVRFLWGWYQGEFDDVRIFQERRGFETIAETWQDLVCEDAFYRDLARDLAG